MSRKIKPIAEDEEVARIAPFFQETVRCLMQELGTELWDNEVEDFFEVFLHHFSGSPAMIDKIDTGFEPDNNYVRRAVFQCTKTFDDSCERDEPKIYPHLKRALEKISGKKMDDPLDHLSELWDNEPTHQFLFTVALLIDRILYFQSALNWAEEALPESHDNDESGQNDGSSQILA
jgi:hypothetical protein